MQILLDIHPGETLWEAYVAEKTIGIVKDTMTRIALETPDLQTTELLETTVLAHNEMEHVRGFSPAQWALGRSPNWDQSFFVNETSDPKFLKHLQGVETTREAWMKKNGSREHLDRKTDRCHGKK